MLFCSKKVLLLIKISKKEKKELKHLKINSNARRKFKEN
jgi:hypothetical protein